MKPMTIILLLAAIVGAALVIKDYFPERDDRETKILKNAVVYAKERQAAAENELKDRERELEHAHATVVHDTAEVRRQKLAYDFGKTHLDTTNVDSLKQQLHRADSVVSSQAKTIVDVLSERDAAVDALAVAHRVIQAADYRAESLERLNAGIQKELDEKNRGRWKHDAKVVLGTAGIIGLLGLAR